VKGTKNKIWRGEGGGWSGQESKRQARRVQAGAEDRVSASA
jgi:hypothetical protein